MQSHISYELPHLSFAESTETPGKALYHAFVCANSSHLCSL